MKPKDINIEKVYTVTSNSKERKIKKEVYEGIEKVVRDLKEMNI